MYLWCNGSIADSKSVRSGFESLGVRQIFVGVSQMSCVHLNDQAELVSRS
jgi:hypothetical protein